MAASARALLFSRFNGQDLFRLSLKPSTSLTPHHLLHPSVPRRESLRNSPSSSSSSFAPPAKLTCLVSGVDGGGVADDFVSTRKATFRREFSVLANVLKQIEPLDTSIIADGVSGPAKDSMKRAISTMLGLLPSDQLTVTIRVSKQPLDRLLVSSIITGYTLWNAEYRVSLMRNFDVSPGISELSVLDSGRHTASKGCEAGEGAGATVDFISSEENERRVPQSLENLLPEALNYIQELETKLAAVEEELNNQKQENMQLECKGEEKNDLLEYLRSLEPYMVTELSRPSSLEVEEIIQQLVQNILKKFFEDDAAGFMEDSSIGKAEEFVDNDKHSYTIETSRDYLAKLLFWCMLLGHHMRGLEYRLHLSCVVGIL